MPIVEIITEKESWVNAQIIKEGTNEEPWEYRLRTCQQTKLVQRNKSEIPDINEGHQVILCKQPICDHPACISMRKLGFIRRHKSMFTKESYKRFCDDKMHPTDVLELLYHVAIEKLTSVNMDTPEGITESMNMLREKHQELSELYKVTKMQKEDKSLYLRHKVMLGHNFMWLVATPKKLNVIAFQRSKLLLTDLLEDYNNLSGITDIKARRTLMVNFAGKKRTLYKGITKEDTYNPPKIGSVPDKQGNPIALEKVKTVEPILEMPKVPTGLTPEETEEFKEHYKKIVRPTSQKIEYVNIWDALYYTYLNKTFVTFNELMANKEIYKSEISAYFSNSLHVEEYYNADPIQK